MEDKLLHVACIVKQAGLYDLLRTLEAHKVGNVEVRPVAPMLALPQPDKHRQADGSKKHGMVQPKVFAAMAMNQKRRVPELAREIGEKKQSVHSAMTVMVNRGLAKRVGFGLYMRVKPDPDVAS